MLQCNSFLHEHVKLASFNLFIFNDFLFVRLNPLFLINNKILWPHFNDICCQFIHKLFNRVCTPVETWIRFWPFLIHWPFVSDNNKCIIIRARKTCFYFLRNVLIKYDNIFENMLLRMFILPMCLAYHFLGFWWFLTKIIGKQNTMANVFICYLDFEILKLKIYF